jgi:hypothetical protein
MLKLVIHVIKSSATTIIQKRPDEIYFIYILMLALTCANHKHKIIHSKNKKIDEAIHGN